MKIKYICPSIEVFSSAEPCFSFLASSGFKGGGEDAHNDGFMDDGSDPFDMGHGNAEPQPPVIIK